MSRGLPGSLHARMLVLSLVAMLVALALGGWTIAGVLERFVTEGLDRRLDAEISLLASTVDGDGRIDRGLLQQRLGVLERGPGWRWRVVGPQGATGSADFPILDPRPRGGPHRDERIEPSEDGLQPLEGVSKNGDRVHARQVTLQTRGGPVVLSAAAPREVVQRPVRGALMPLLVALGAMAMLLGGSTVLQLRWGLRPLRLLRDEVEAIRTGRREWINEDQPAELRPLAIELNQLAADNAAALRAARLSAANLAHALKTPVAALALELRGLPGPAAQVRRIDTTIRHHLNRARVEAIDRRALTVVAPAIADLVEAVRRIHAGESRSIEIDVSPDLSVAVDAQDFDELVGNLVDNAARHAAARVRVTAYGDPADPRRVHIRIDDDGPGIPLAQRGTVSRPGTRLDERGDGHGFGLAIVCELAQLYGGSFTLGDSSLGGLAATLTLPAGPC